MKVLDLNAFNVGEMAEFFSNNFSDGWTENMLISSFSTNHFYALGVLDQQKLSGVLTFSVVDDTADIEDIVVDKDKRRKGIAKTLMEKAFQIIKEKGAKRVMLEVREGNIPAKSLYQKLGFREISIRKKYYQDGENAVVMQKEF